MRNALDMSDGREHIQLHSQEQDGRRAHRLAGFWRLGWCGSSERKDLGPWIIDYATLPSSAFKLWRELTQVSLIGRRITAFAPKLDNQAEVENLEVDGIDRICLVWYDCVGSGIEFETWP